MKYLIFFIKTEAAVHNTLKYKMRMDMDIRFWGGDERIQSGGDERIQSGETIRIDETIHIDERIESGGDERIHLENGDEFVSKRDKDENRTESYFYLQFYKYNLLKELENPSISYQDKLSLIEKDKTCFCFLPMTPNLLAGGLMDDFENTF